MEQSLARVLDDVTVARLTEQARDNGVLVDEGGLLQQLTRRFLEASLEGELDAHLGLRDGHIRCLARTPAAT